MIATNRFYQTDRKGNLVVNSVSIKEETIEDFQRFNQIITPFKIKSKANTKGSFKFDNRLLLTKIEHE